METVEQLRALLARRFDPTQPRNADGEWTSGPGGAVTHVAADALKLAGKIHLEPDEKLLASAKLDGDTGGVRMALTEQGGQRMLRLGLGSEGYGQRNRDEGIPAWDGNPPHAPLSKAERERLNAEMDKLDAEYHGASPARQDEITARTDAIREQLTASDLGFNGTAKLDEYSTRRLIDRIRPALAEAVDQEKAENAAWDEIEALQAKGNPDPARMAQLRQIVDHGSAGFITFTQGIVPGSAWGDVHYQVELDDLSVGPQVVLGVTPKGAPDDWGSGKDWEGKFDVAESRKLIKLLDGMVSRSLTPADGPEVARMHSADGGPSSAPAGPKGGQFALGGGRVSAKGKTRPTHPTGKGRPAVKPAAHGPLGYDGKTGVGYGIKGGDPRVRTLQSVLNRLGLKDAAGQTLAVDGKFGPRTTAAVKKLQQAMGQEPTGKVTEDFIKQVANLRALPPKPKTRTVKKPMRRSSAGTQPYGDVKYADPGYQPDGKERYPLDSEAHCRAAWSYINQADNAAQYSPRDLAKVKARIKAALKRYGVDVQDSARSRILGEMGLVRSGPLTYNRVFPLDDIQISRSGDGRTVEAYAATFDTPYEVRDQHGHYMEVIDRSAFNRTLNGAGKNAICVYNHGMTIHGTPDGMASLPLGKPLEIKPDGKGLLTVTRYNDGPWADSVLASIRNGDIKAQSFRGQIYRSSPNGRVPKRRHLAEPLPTVTRHELGLSDYGPTPTAVNDASAIVAVRSAADIIDAIQFLDADEREELLRTLGDLDTTPEEDPDDEDVLAEIEEEDASATSDDSEPGAEDPPAERSEAGHSGRLELQRAALRAELILKGVRRAEAA